MLNNTPVLCLCDEGKAFLPGFEGFGELRHKFFHVLFSLLLFFLMLILKHSPKQADIHYFINLSEFSQLAKRIIMSIL